MATLTATGNGKRTKVVKNVNARNVEQKTEDLYNLGYTQVSVDWGKTKVAGFERETALPVWVGRGSIEEMLG